jgi:hypothetical protein
MTTADDLRTEGPVAANDTDSPRVVLFGAPSTGKSALLGALAQSEPVPLTLIDSSGRAVQEYLDGQRSLDDRAPLASAVDNADALVLTVDSAAPKQFEEIVQQYKEFLQSVEQRRSRRSDVAGLPVFMVLTKCDLLARAGDTAANWIKRVDENERNLRSRFPEFLDQGHEAFGTIDLRLGAVAIKQPALSDRPSHPSEPYGVAELFREVASSARLFHEQCHRAGHSLHVAVMSLLGMIAVTALAVLGFFAMRPSAEVASLENSIRAVLATPESSAALRLREPLAPRLKELIKIQENASFTSLPPPLQDAVRQAIREMTAYQGLAKKVDELKRVRFLKNEDEVQKVSREIDNVVLPPEFASQWGDTRLSRKIAQYKRELAALARALAGEQDWLKKQIAEGETLLNMAIPGAGSPERQAWINRADVFLRRKDPSKQVPDIPNMKLRDLYEFPTVNGPREDYEVVRSRVARIRGGLANSS